jgi:hypothetical protein
MTATVSKVVAYGLTGKSGMNVSKFVGYVLLTPSSSGGGGGAGVPSAAFAYGQVLSKPNPVGA